MDTILHILKSLHPEVDFSRDQNLVEEGILDSFDIITIVTELDDQLAITVPPEMLTAKNFASPQAMLAMVKELLP